MRARASIWLLSSAVLVTACDNPTALPMAAPSAGNASVGTLSTCDAPVILTTPNSILTAQPVKLQFTPDDVCRWEDQVEIYDDATNVRVVHDTSPESKTYSFGSYSEYQTSELQRGRYYRWRLRAMEKSSTGAILQYSPWSNEVRFGVALLSPSVSGSIESWYAHLTWPTVDGASHYIVGEAYNEPGWESYDETTVTGTTYDGSLCVTEDYTDHSVTYWVKAVSASGIESAWTRLSFYACGVAPI